MPCGVARPIHLLHACIGIFPRDMYALLEPFDAFLIVWLRRRPAFPSRLPLNHLGQGNLMMMIKRLIALIALASSAATAQPQPGPDEGNIPAPNLFDGQIVCTNELPIMVPTPTVVPTGAMESELDTAIGMGTAGITDRVVLNAIGYVVPPGGGNCGQGRYPDRIYGRRQGLRRH